MNIYIALMAFKQVQVFGIDSEDETKDVLSRMNAIFIPELCLKTHKGNNVHAPEK